MRWKTVTAPASLASSGSTCTPDDPVPISPTRWPASGTGACGQFAVEYCSPAKVSAPGNAGTLAADSAPTAVIRNLAVASYPPADRTVQRAAGSSHVTLVTLVPNLKSLSRSSRSATVCR